MSMLYEKEASTGSYRLTQEEILEGKTLDEKYLSEENVPFTVTMAHLDEETADATNSEGADAGNLAWLYLESVWQ